MSEFPKWVSLKDAHLVEKASKTHQIHDDRVVGVSVLVHDAKDEAAVLSGEEVSLVIEKD